MKDSKIKYYRYLFLIAAVYDLLLGVVFLFFHKAAFRALGVSSALPDEPAYVALLGAFVIVIGIGYALVYRGNLTANMDLILVGLLYKLAYSAVGFYYYLFATVPHVLFVFIFGVADVLFFILMAECWMYLRNEQKLAA
ncbi:MAG: hypothetical protein HKN43_00075 [Rhodothermales bacterium]|nr:hypothetical protein [Rhodothermales bacterium]